MTVTDRLAERAARLRQHLEAFAVQFGFWWQCHWYVKENYFLDGDGPRAVINQSRTTKPPTPCPYQLNLFGLAGFGDNSAGTVRQLAEL
jgi:hypothetical protein